jgi:hypothetical protein
MRASSPAVLQHAPIEVPDPLPLRFTSGTTTKQRWVNYKHVAQDYTAADIQRILSAECKCGCMRAAHPELFPAGSQHIISTAPQPILQDDTLELLWRAGANSRLHVPLSHAGFVKAIAELELALRRYAGTLEADAGANAGMLQEWQQAVLAAWTAELQRRWPQYQQHSQHINATQPQPGKRSRDPCKPPPTPDSTAWRFPHALYTDQLHAELMLRTKGFVITVMDKSSATLVLVCEKRLIFVGYSRSRLYSGLWAHTQRHPQLYSPAKPDIRRLLYRSIRNELRALRRGDHRRPQRQRQQQQQPQRRQQQ